MQFPGYWVGGSGNDIEVVRTFFDETELSNTSNWQEAWQNEDPAEDHGYVDPLSMLHDVSRRIVSQLSSDELDALRADMRDGRAFAVKSLEDLARLIQIAIPAAMPAPSSGNNRAVAVDDGQDIPFD
jgi:hypothetical protein